MPAHLIVFFASEALRPTQTIFRIVGRICVLHPNAGRFTFSISHSATPEVDDKRVFEPGSTAAFSKLNDRKGLFYSLDGRFFR
jgi:hypothetical protein